MEKKYTMRGIVRTGIVKAVEVFMVFGAILVPMGAAELLCRLLGVG